MWFEDKVRRHKQLTEGRNFNRLMELAKAAQIDWILIATFDRWGISDKDDIFVFRKKLKEMDVRLWSVADELEITGGDDSSFWRVAARAEAATGYVAQQAQKNIQKMLSMAQLGLAGSGNAPYAVDLVCYPLIGGHAPDLTKPMFRVVRERYIRPSLYKVVYPDGREEVTEKMPLRDKKATAYRYERSQDDRRLRAVSLIYELYDSGMNFGQISEALWKQGYAHYDKPFGQHGVESILRNPIYTGRPAWGKSGVGQYYLALNGQAVKANRRAKDPHVIHKGREHYTQPPVAIWDPIVPVELWERIQARLDNRAKNDPAFGMRRQKSEVKHPLHRKVVCPDCGEEMVMGSSQSKGYVKRYFVCGLYRRTIRKKCRPNSIPFSVFDDAIVQLLGTVKGRIDALTGASSLTATLMNEEWAKRTELGRTLARVVNTAYLGFDTDHDELGKIAQHLDACVEGGRSPMDEAPAVEVEEFDGFPGIKWASIRSMDDYVKIAVETYNARFERESGGARAELAQIDQELDNIVTAISGGIPSPTVRDKLNTKMTALEERKRALTAKLVPLTLTVEALTDQLKAVRSMIDEVKGDALARVLDTFIDRVEVAFEGEPVRGHGRPVTLTFVPREGSVDVLTQPMKISPVRRGMGSWRRPGRNRPGTSCSAGRG